MGTCDEQDDDTDGGAIGVVDDIADLMRCDPRDEDDGDGEE